MSWRNFFFVFGMSCKAFDFEKKIRGNCMALWSLLSNTIFAICVTAVLVLEIFYPHAWNDHFLRYVSLQIFSITALSDLISVRVTTSCECEFWKLYDLLNLQRRKYQPSRLFKWQTAFHLSDLVFYALKITSQLFKNGFIKTLESSRYFSCLIVYKIFVLKFCFFMDVLAFNLNESNCFLFSNKKQQSKKQIKKFWRMKQQIDKIFGFPLILNCAVVVSGAVSSINIFYKNMGERILIVPIIFAYIEVFVLGFACQLVAKKLTTIKHTVFSRAIASNEMLILQLHHQSLEVSPLQIFVTDHKLIVSVCNILTRRILTTEFISDSDHSPHVQPDFDTIS